MLKSLFLVCLLFVSFGVAQATAFDQTPEEKITAMGLEIPKVRTPGANYIKAVRTGNLLYLAGHGECDDPLRGKLGADVSVEEGYASAQRVALCLLGTMKAELGSLSKVVKFVRLEGMVNSAPDFVEQSSVINGASDFFVTVFGDKGRHARAAVGMASLPGGIAVEITLIVEVEGATEAP